MQIGSLICNILLMELVFQLIILINYFRYFIIYLFRLIYQLDGSGYLNLRLSNFPVWTRGHYL